MRGGLDVFQNNGFGLNDANVTLMGTAVGLGYRGAYEVREPAGYPRGGWREDGSRWRWRMAALASEGGGGSKLI